MTDKINLKEVKEVKGMAKITECNGTFYLVDGDKTVELNLTEDKLAMILPENSSNRKWFNVQRFRKNAINDELELTYKATIHLGERNADRKPVETYISDEDRPVYEAIMERAKKAKDEAENKPLTEAEKLQKKIDDLTKKLAALEK